MASLLLMNPYLLVALVFLGVVSLFLQLINAYFSITLKTDKPWIMIMECILTALVVHGISQIMILLNEAKKGNIESYSKMGMFGEVIIQFALVFLLLVGIRAFILILRKQRRMRTVVTGYTVRYVMDTLSEGIIFVDDRGRRIFTNNVMYEVCERILGKHYQLKESFWDVIVNVPENASFEKRKLDDKFLFRFSDKTYEFSKAEVQVGNKIYTRYLASDVTKRDITLQRLEVQTHELADATKNLVWMLENIEQIKKEEEIAKMMRHLHDVCAQRVSIVRRAMLSKKEMDYEYLEEMLNGFTEDMEHGLVEEPIEKLQDIQTSFCNIGMEIVVHGEMPTDHNKCNVLCDVFREAATNALRHANANHIDIFIRKMKKGTKVEIYNNGENPKEGILEGNGIRGMRENIEGIHGALDVKIRPRFKIIIYLFKESM
jgi:signal transduction histidine kinase